MACFCFGKNSLHKLKKGILIFKNLLVHLELDVGLEYFSAKDYYLSIFIYIKHMETPNVFLILPSDLHNILVEFLGLLIHISVGPGF